MLDEIWWADDEERSAWTRLLLAGEYRHILLLGAVEALPLVNNAFPQAEVRFFERKAPLDWFGAVAFQSQRPGTVVVAFSRRAVLALAELNRARGSRRRALRRDAAGVAPRRDRPLRQRRCGSRARTDVLGHGVNLPCETPCSRRRRSSTAERRDGTRGRSHLAGRAGRFGLVERGHVGVLTGLWAQADPDLVDGPRAARERAATMATGWSTWRIRPRLRGSARSIARTARGLPRLAHRRAAAVATEAGSPSSRSSASSPGSTPSSGVCASAAARWGWRRRGSSSTPRSTKTTGAARRPRPGGGGAATAAGPRLAARHGACATPRSRTRAGVATASPCWFAASSTGVSPGYHRSCRRPGAGRRGAGERAARGRGALAVGRALPLVRAKLRAVVRAVRALLRRRAPLTDPCATVRAPSSRQRGRRSTVTPPSGWWPPCCS